MIKLKPGSRVSEKAGEAEASREENRRKIVLLCECPTGPDKRKGIG